MSCVGVYKVKEKGMDTEEKFQRIVSEEKEEDIMKSLQLERVKLYISTYDRKRIQKLADKTDTVPQYIIREALTLYLDKHEDTLTRTQYYENINNS